MRTRRLIISLVLLAGCGESDEAVKVTAADRKTPERTVQMWLKAMAAGDTAAACELLLPWKRETVMDPKPGSKPGCENQLAGLKPSVDQRFTPALDTIRFTRNEQGGGPVGSVMLEVENGDPAPGWWITIEDQGVYSIGDFGGFNME